MDKTNKMKQKKKNMIYLVLGIVLLGSVIGGLFLVLMPASILPPSDSVANRSTFEYVDYITGEDVSWVPFTIWTPKSASEFETLEHIYDISLYQSAISSRASAISIDLSSYEYVLVQPDPDDDAPYSENWQLITPGGLNDLYTIYAIDPATDVNFNVFDELLNEVDVSSHQTDGNYTLIYDIPHWITTEAQMHFGTNWDVTASEFADLSASARSWYYDEANFAGLFGRFNPQDDTYVYKSTQLHSVLSAFTNCFAFKLIFNDSISLADGNVLQVNFTLEDNVPFEVVISSSIIYLVLYEPMLFTGGMLDFDFEIEYAVNITLTDIDSGNLPIRQSGNAFGTFVKLSDIAA